MAMNMFLQMCRQRVSTRTDWFRLSLLILMAIFGFAPAVHWIVLNGGLSSPIVKVSYIYGILWTVFHITAPVLFGVQQGVFGTRDSLLFRQDIRKLGFKIVGNGIRYTHGTWNVLIFLLGKREK